MIFYLDYQETLNIKSFNQKKTSANFKFLKQAIEANGGIFSVTIIPPKSSYLKGDPKRDKLKKILNRKQYSFSRLKSSIERFWYKARMLFGGQTILTLVQTELN
jgi:hypothetical protein